MTTELLEKKEELKGGIGNDTPTQLPEEKPLDVQTTLNEMFIKHGGNLPERADYKELLADYSLILEQITPKHLSIARKNLAKFIEEESKKQGPERDNKLEWDTEPTTFQCETSKGVRWVSKCKRYRVDMRQAMDVERPYFTSSYLTAKGNDMCCEFAPPKENNSEGSEPRKYKTLDAALSSVEKWHEDRYKLSLVFSNRPQVLDTAVELGLITKPKAGGKPVVVASTTASVPSNTPSVAQGGTSSQGQATGQPVKQRAPRTPRQPGEGTDGFGYRAGSQAATISAAITDQLQTFEEILKVCQTADPTIGKGRCKSHINHMLGKGYAEVVSGKYKLKQKVVAMPIVEEKKEEPVQEKPIEPTTAE